MKIKSLYFCLLVVSFLGTPGIAQQESQFINVANNPFIINPAAGGLTDVMQFEVTSRTQWLGYNGGPRTLMFTGNSQIKVKKGGGNVLSEYNVEDKTFFSNPKVTVGKVKHVVGGKAINDAIGPFAKSSVHGSYSIHLPFTKKMNFGVGIGIGWSNFRINQDRVVLHQDDDLAYSQFLGNSSAQNYIDANAGIIFYSSKFVAGVSTSQLLKNKATFDDIATESNYNRHYFLTLKYAIDINDNFTLEPQIVGKLAEKSPGSMDLGTRLIYDRSIWLGVHYRTSNALVFQVGANIIKNLYLAYGYEYATGRIKTSGNSSHEIQLGFYLGNNRNIDKEIKDNKIKTDAETD